MGHHQVITTVQQPSLIVDKESELSVAWPMGTVAFCLYTQKMYARLGRGFTLIGPPEALSTATQTSVQMGVVSQSPAVYAPGESRPLSLTIDGRVRVSAPEDGRVWQSTFDDPWSVACPHAGETP